jgi:hypothetical protein
MVQINKDTVNIKLEHFDKKDHIRMIKSLLYFLMHCDKTFTDAPDETYYVCTLIEQMLPDSGQILNTDDVELFQQFKKQQK